MDQCSVLAPVTILSAFNWQIFRLNPTIDPFNSSSRFPRPCMNKGPPRLNLFSGQNQVILPSHFDSLGPPRTLMDYHTY